MRESIVPMHREKPGRSQDDPSPAHRCDEFQPGNPWRVALQQSSPPLPRPSSGSTINSRPPSESQRTAHRAFPNCLTQGVHPSSPQRLVKWVGADICCKPFILQRLAAMRSLPIICPHFAILISQFHKRPPSAARLAFGSRKPRLCPNLGFRFLKRLNYSGSVPATAFQRAICRKHPGVAG